jgi:uncharacterized membrane protein
VKHRFWQIDIARGVAIIGMVLYHFLVDLEMIYGIPIGVYKMPVVLLARIVAITFIFLMGMSASIRFEKSGDNRWFVKRAINIGFWAGVISVVTYIIFPENYIYFGILHFMAVSILLLIPLLKMKSNILLLGLGILIVGLSFVRLETFLPNISSFDYFPLVPWLGVLIFGIVAGRVIKFNKNNNNTRLLATIGQKSLLIYLLHQPILWSSLWITNQLFFKR